jgi:hypothetical protein
VSVEEVAVLVAACDLNHNLDVAGMAEDREFVLGNEGHAAGMRPVVSPGARRRERRRRSPGVVRVGVQTVAMAGNGGRAP